MIATAGGIDGKSEVDLLYGGKRYRYPVPFFLAHALAHGVEHRTEVKLILGQHGIATPNLDGWDYSAAAGYGQAVEDSA